MNKAENTAVSNSRRFARIVTISDSKKYCNSGRVKLPLSVGLKWMLALQTCFFIVVIFLLDNHRVFRNDPITEQNENDKIGEKKPLIAVVACIKSTNTDKRNVQEYKRSISNPSQSLEQYLIRSLHESLTEHERRHYRVELILGYDEGDAYWHDRQHQLSAEKNGHRLSSLFDARYDPLPISFLAVRKLSHSKSFRKRIHRIPFNEVCRAAYEYGADYIVRVNDDSRFITPGWITLAIRELHELHPPRLGVVGPTCLQGNVRDGIMTHDMVHAPTHFAIFHTYYPLVFDNWFVDDWISHVYGPNRTRQLSRWEVMHYTYAYGQRYTTSLSQKDYLNATLKEGQILIDNFLKNTNKTSLTLSSLELNNDADKNKTLLSNDNMVVAWKRILGTDALGQVDGPMAIVHSSLLHQNNKKLTQY